MYMSEMLNTNTEQRTLPTFPENKQDLEAMHQETLRLVVEKLGAVAAADYASFSALANRETGSFGPTGSTQENLAGMQQHAAPETAPERVIPPNAHIAPAAQQPAPVTYLETYRQARQAAPHDSSREPFPPHSNISVIPPRPMVSRRSRWARFRDYFDRRAA